MMWLVSSLLLLCAASALCYASTRHQRLLHKPLPRRWRWLAVALLLLAIGCARVQLSQSATVFFCLLLLMLAAMLLPLATLLGPKEGNHHGR
jgi:formate hydrogenlyase subunit 3/multisubunit Na+/H+ antiporter MnhD subunit